MGTGGGRKKREIPDTWWFFLHKSLQLVSRAHSRTASCASLTTPLAYTEVTWTDTGPVKELKNSVLSLLCTFCDMDMIHLV